MKRTRRTLHFVAGVVLCTMGSQAMAGTTTNDLIFVIDRSHSIMNEWDFEVDGLWESICGVDKIIPGTSNDEYRITVITFHTTSSIAANLDGVVINDDTRQGVCDAIDDLHDLEVEPGRSGFARRDFIRPADVGPSPTYPVFFRQYDPPVWRFRCYKVGGTASARETGRTPLPDTWLVGIIG